MQAEALLQLGMKFALAQPHDAFGLGGALGPHDRRAIVGQRQNGEGAGGQKMLLGAAVMRALMRHRGDDRRLAVGPADRRDAGALADAGARAVGGDQKPGLNRGAGSEPHGDARRIGIEVRHRARQQAHALACRLLEQGRQHVAVLDHVGERLARLHLAGEIEEDRAHRVVELRICDHHVEDRLGLRRDRVPHPDGLEQAARRRRDRGGARVLAAASERRIGDRHRESVAERLAQRDGERDPGETAARDQNIRALMWVRHRRSPALPRPPG